ncbi:Bax inhibitor-1/YccA family protein [Candidatus Saccharibacteria bacterium]|nr:Bax inhibitor-1/YccA family protein [Candidatus Saccharibacteria bacterium]
MEQSEAKTQSTETFSSYMAGVFAWMFTGLSVSGIIGYLISTSGENIQALVLNPISFLILVVLQFGIVIFLSARITKLSANAARAAFLAYAASVGATLSMVFLAYTNTSIMRVFFIAGSMFLVMAIIGYTTKVDLSKLGMLLIMGLLGIIIASLVNIFIGSSTLELIMSYLGVVIFLGLTAYDIQKIKKVYAQFGSAGNLAILGALSLYLDFLNLFLFLLRIFGVAKD